MSCWENLFGYINYSNDTIKPLLIKLPKINGSMTSFGERMSLCKMCVIYGY